MLLINLSIGPAVLVGTRVLVEGQRYIRRLDTVEQSPAPAGLLRLPTGSRGPVNGRADLVTLTNFAMAVAFRSRFSSCSRAARVHSAAAALTYGSTHACLAAVLVLAWRLPPPPSPSPLADASAATPLP